MSDEREVQIQVVLDDLEVTLRTAQRALLRLRPDFGDYPRWWNEMTRAAERLEEEASHLRRIPAAQEQDERVRPVLKAW